jgi:hypothetical protein
MLLCFYWSVFSHVHPSLDGGKKFHQRLYIYVTCGILHELQNQGLLYVNNFWIQKCPLRVSKEVAKFSFKVMNIILIVSATRKKIVLNTINAYSENNALLL